MTILLGGGSCGGGGGNNSTTDKLGYTEDVLEKFETSGRNGQGYYCFYSSWHTSDDLYFEGCIDATGKRYLNNSGYWATEVKGFVEISSKLDWDNRKRYDLLGAFTSSDNISFWIAQDSSLGEFWGDTQYNFSGYAFAGTRFRIADADIVGLGAITECEQTDPNDRDPNDRDECFYSYF